MFSVNKRSLSFVCKAGLFQSLFSSLLLVLSLGGGATSRASILGLVTVPLLS